MAGMGGGGAGGTALLARRSWLLVRGRHGVNGAAGAAEAQVGAAARTAKPCSLKRRWGGGRGWRGGWGIMAKGLLRLCWRRLGRLVVRLEELEMGGWGGGWVWVLLRRRGGEAGAGRACKRMTVMVLEGVSAD
jgi:hypothetical protein